MSEAAGELAATIVATDQTANVTTKGWGDTPKTDIQRTAGEGAERCGGFKISVHAARHRTASIDTVEVSAREFAQISRSTQLLAWLADRMGCTVKTGLAGRPCCGHGGAR